MRSSKDSESFRARGFDGRLARRARGPARRGRGPRGRGLELRRLGLAVGVALVSLGGPERVGEGREEGVHGLEDVGRLARGL